MADFIIKPAAGDTLKLQDEGGDDAISISTTGVSTIANATITAGTFPAGHVIYHNATTVLADSETTMDNNWQTATNQTVTVPAATANLCSKIVIHWNASAQVYKGSSHHFVKIRCYRSTPNATEIGKPIHTGVNGQTLGTNVFYGSWGLVVTDTSLSNADHTYILQKTNPASYCGNAQVSQLGTNIVVWGIK